jgi:hypothetical protein
MSSYTIDLQDYRTPHSKVFTGRDRGMDVRNKTKIDKLISEFDKIVIKIPEDIRSINPSFLEEFLLNIVMKLGKDQLSKKLEIVNDGRYKVEEDLTKAIDRILRGEHALS